MKLRLIKNNQHTNISGSSLEDLNLGSSFGWVDEVSPVFERFSWLASGFFILDDVWLGALSEQDSASLLPESAKDRQAVNKALYQLASSGHLIRIKKGLWGLSERMDLFPARINANPEGHGHAVPDNKGEWLYLPAREMRRVMHGDRVLCCVANVDRRGRTSGQIIEVLERAVEHVVGRYLEQRGVGLVIPDDPRLQHDVIVDLDTQPHQVLRLCYRHQNS